LISCRLLKTVNCCWHYQCLPVVLACVLINTIIMTRQNLSSAEVIGQTFADELKLKSL
jgi:hypothetical protein